METEGTHLHRDWLPLPAPAIAKGYWRLKSDATWRDTLRCIYADESNHRDVNHTFATMDEDDPNPFLNKHQENARKAWYIEQGKEDPK